MYYFKAQFNFGSQALWLRWNVINKDSEILPVELAVFWTTDLDKTQKDSKKGGAILFHTDILVAKIEVKADLILEYESCHIQLILIDTTETDLVCTGLSTKAEICDIHCFRKTTFCWCIENCIQRYVFENFVNAKLVGCDCRHGLGFDGSLKQNTGFQS